MHVFFLWGAVPVNRDSLSIICLIESVCATAQTLDDAYTGGLTTFLPAISNSGLLCTDVSGIYARGLNISPSFCAHYSLWVTDISGKQDNPRSE